MIITIDGPTASGKSTMGRLLAKRLGFYYLYSGLLFRGFAYLLIDRAGYTLATIAHPSAADIDHYLDPKRFVYTYDSEHEERIVFDGHDITPATKGSEIAQAASMVSGDSAVRAKILLLQRALANDHNLVVDGRDAGSIAFAQAEVKFFLTAADMVRARRWQEQQKRYGNRFSLDQALAEITERDRRDSQRAIAPLQIPQGAILIDNSDLDQEATLAQMLGWVKMANKKRG